MSPEARDALARIAAAAAAGEVADEEATRLMTLVAVLDGRGCDDLTWAPAGDARAGDLARLTALGVAPALLARA
ncbi:MAG: hypothetical protein MUE51_02020 [Thermoleophilia bacterium]|nr:hypothetical protein [Thermoleophilia bacterium]